MRCMAARVQLIEIVYEEVQDLGSRVGAVVSALAFHICGPGSISWLAVLWFEFVGSLLCSKRFFPPGTPVFPSQQKPIFD